MGNTISREQQLLPEVLEPSTSLLLLKRLLLTLPLTSIPIPAQRADDDNNNNNNTGTIPPSTIPPLSQKPINLSSTSSPSPSLPRQYDDIPPIQWTTLSEPFSSPTGEYLVARHKSTLRIQLNRPRKGNALSLAMIESLTTLFREVINKDPTIHRVIITGKGKYFCTGMDLGSSTPSYSSSSTTQEEEEDQDTEDPLFSPTLVPLHARLLSRFFHTIDTCPKQTIALLNGPAFGGGVGLLTVCDIRLASASSSSLPSPSSPKSSSNFFCCLSEVRLGLCPATIARYIVREWGPSLARMAMLSGRKISADTLLSAGVLHGLLPVSTAEEQEECLERAFVKEWLLPDLRCAAPGAVGMCKGLVRTATGGEESDTDIVDRQGVRAFEEMLLGGGGGSGEKGSGERMNEARVGVGLFRKGVKGVVWEDMTLKESHVGDEG